MSSSGEQTWFRSGDRTLEGWVHRPDDDEVRGAVVIAGPFAHEALVTYRALRLLAVAAARRGFVTVRFSWSSTGDSEPAPDGADLAAVWSDDLAAAAELARAASGMDAVDAIGVRFGAAIVAATGTLFRQQVLWAPLGGRAFLRMQSSLLTLHLPDDFPRAERGVELCGYTLDEGAAASLRAVPDPRRAAPPASSDRAPIIVEDDPAAAEELFEREPGDARVPRASIERVVAALPAAPPAPLPAWDPTRETVTRDPVEGVRIRQTLVAIGPDRLPGIFSEPLDGPSAAVAALFIPFGTDAKGVSRTCRATSHRLARSGVPSLRADRRGIGDAADPDALEEGPFLTPAGAADVAGFATWLTERTARPVVGIGLCSGAWLIAQAAVSFPFQRLVMVNNQAWSTSRGYWDRQSRILDEFGTRTPGTAIEPRPGIVHRLKRLIRSHAPYVLRYRLFVRLDIDAIAEQLLGPVPVRTSVKMSFGDADMGPWKRALGPETVRRLTRRGHPIDVEHDPRADHALMSQTGYDAYLEFLDREFVKTI